MSLGMMREVLKMKLEPNEKLVLLALTDRATGPNLGDIEVKEVRKKTGLPLLDIEAIVQKLIKQGVLEKKDRPEPKSIFFLRY